MILNEFIEIKVATQKIEYYKNLGYEFEKAGDTIKAKIADLSKSSKVIINVKCDYCNSELEISYKQYNRSLSRGNKFACSSKCADIKRREILFESQGVTNLSYLDEIKDKRKKTSLEKYGVESHFHDKSVREKIKQSIIDKYGVDNYAKTDEYIERVKKINLEKYGVEWSLKSEEIKDKSKKTNLEKYGFEQASKNQEIINKIKDTNIEKYGFVSPLLNGEILKKSKKTLEKNYGVDNPFKSEEIKKKSKLKNLEKYGVEYPMQSDFVRNNLNKSNLEKHGVEWIYQTEEFKKKSRETNLKKYGFYHYTKTDEFKENFKEDFLEKWGVDNPSKSEILRSNMIISSDVNYISYIENGISLFKCDLGKDHCFEIKSDNYLKRKEYNTPLCTICHPIGDKKSIKEIELFNFIKENYNGEIIQSYRSDLEIDIYLPDLKLGFEFNGLYWHSDEWKDKNYHLNKTNHFKNLGIKIVHIWEDDWDNKKEIIKSQIKNWLSLNSNKIFARNCEVKIINDSKVSRNFLDNNHIQGFINSKIKIGLYYNDELVSLICFDQSEGRKKMKKGEWNLSRFCNKINTSVVGGASKLLSFFVRKYEPVRIVSYADKDWSSGDLYYKLGFINLGESKPDYKYLIKGKRFHKSRYRKSNLKTNLSESEYMNENGYYKIWDCGKIKFQLIFS